LEFAEDEEVVFFLFCEVDAGVEDDLLATEPGLGGEGDFFFKKGGEVVEEVVPFLMGVCAESCVAVVGEGGDVVEDVDVFVDDLSDDFWAPSVDGEERWGELMAVGSFGFVAELGFGDLGCRLRRRNRR